MSTSQESFTSGIGRALRCLFPGDKYELLPRGDTDQQSEEPENGRPPGIRLSAPYSCTMDRHGWDVEEVAKRVPQTLLAFDSQGGNPHVVASAAAAPPSISRQELEARVEALRKSTPLCEPYTRDKVDYKCDVNLRTRSGKRSIDEAYGLVMRAAKQHVEDRDRKPMTFKRVLAMGLSDFCSSYVPAEVRRGIDKIWYEDVNVSFDKVFSVNGDADLEPTRRDQLKVWHERQTWLSTILRTLSLDMAGAIKSNVLLQGVDSLIPSAQKYRADRRTRFHERAMAYTPPTKEQVEWHVKPNSTSTHPKYAAYRHLNATTLRELVRDLGAVQYDPSISSAARDRLAHGDRHIIQLKDFKHVGPSQPPQIETLRGDIGGCEPKQVSTVFDMATYMTSLRPFAGTDIILTLPIYSSLSGETEEGTYYCTGVDANGHALYTETIGAKETSGVFRNQYSWNFTENDVVYLRAPDDSGFGIYDVVKHARSDINRQTVFLCMNTWVNIPFEVADQLVFAAHGVRFSDTHSEPEPCRNVTVVNGSSDKPILVMNVIKGHRRLVYTRFQKETSPQGTATVMPTVLRFLEHLHENGGRNYGLSSREHLNKLQLHMKDVLPGGQVDAPDYASLLELLRVVGVPDPPNAVYYPEDYVKDNPGEETPSESRTAKAVQQVPSITTNPHTYGAVAPDDAALQRAAEVHLGGGNTTKRGPQLSKIVKFTMRYFLESLADKSGCTEGSIQVVPRDKVLENRTRAAQRANEITSGLGPSVGDDVGRAFVKVEVAKLKDAPRMIQSPNHEQSIDSGRLGMSLDQIFKSKSGVSHGVDWYAPGKCPSELADALREQFEQSYDFRTRFKAGRIPQVDYKNADDSHTEESAELLADIIRYFFSDDHCPDLGESHKSWALRTYHACFNMHVQVGAKVKSTKWKNASGTGITTLLNTLVFAFRAYLTVILSLLFQQQADDDGVIQGMPVDDTGKADPVAAGKSDCFTMDAFRKQLDKVQASGVLYEAIDFYDTAELSFIPKTTGPTAPVSASNRAATNVKTPVMRLAFDLIGLKLGDDGVEFNVPGVTDAVWYFALKYLDTADGFNRTVVFSDPEQFEDIEFLSRNYPNLMETGASYCKLERAAEKLAVSANPDLEKYRNKLVGYKVTDRFTPIIGAFIDAIWAYKGFGDMPVDIDPGTGAVHLSSVYLSKVEAQDRELAYKMREGPYPVSEGDLDHMYESAAAQYGWSSDELRAFDDNLRSQKTWAGIKGCTLPPALALLTADDPTGDKIEKTVPPGVSMVHAWPALGTAAANRDPDAPANRIFPLRARTTTLDALTEAIKLPGESGGPAAN